MTLVLLIAVPLAGALLGCAPRKGGDARCRAVSLAAFAVNLALTVSLWAAARPHGRWIAEFARPWIPPLGASFHLGVDGLSLLLVALANFLGIMATAASWRGIGERVRFFHANLLWMAAAVIGVFLALDLFLFSFFWEMMLVPLYLLIGIWGHERRRYAALKFILFTQAAGVVLLLSILGLYFAHGRATGIYTFDYASLLGTPLSRGAGTALMLGFFIPFVVKLAAVPLHTWLPDAHTQAPTAGSVMLAGLVLKAGAYGLIRFAVPLFPQESARLAPFATAIGAAGILYGALLAFGQTDIKRLVAYTSVSHMGFVLAGIYAGGRLALEGAVMVMLAHGVSTSALFILVGSLGDRIGTRELGAMGGLWATAPRWSGAMLVFALASLGLPGFGNFVGEFLVLAGTFAASPAVAAAAAGGLVASVIYALRIFQGACQGPNAGGWAIPDLTRREAAIAACMILATLWLGLYPGAALRAARPAVEALRPAAERRAP